MKKIAILGSTGSIGASALDVVSENPDRFEVISLAAGRNIELLKRQIETFKPRMAAVIDEAHAAKLRSVLPQSCHVEVVSGLEGYCRMVAEDDVDLVLSAMVGAAGLLPTVAAIEAGKDVALANKETMVIAGQIVMEKAKMRGVRILPVDSEHSAIFQCLEGYKGKYVRRIILTASGGPFWGMSLEQMKNLRPEQALKHPRWNMGRKITVDSATMMNKGLEIMEARWLFDIPFERIEVIIHPQSVIHSMVEYDDGSIIAQLGEPDMRIPIAYALSYPERIHRDGPFLDFASFGSLSFFEPDEERFPCLRLARRAGEAGASMPTILNAANEVAVDKYLEGTIRFTDIPLVVEAAMERAPQISSASSVAELMEADRDVRMKTINYIKERVK
ncbi:MAG: 1-deoxy-D-xylulose-5-phosphate reductoisomerase [Syntrophales bacterium]|nr:1-deoxy-D-xylulose-5-phosphate reductoisomerase [Syntrophales bacterium]